MRLSNRTLLVGAAVAAAYFATVRPWQLRWGASPDEEHAELTGDALVADPDLVSTRAIDIAASQERVWPWIAQIGQARGGFYSYDFLENLVGCEISSADRVVGQWQNISVGDVVKLHPDLDMHVAIAERGSALVLAAASELAGAATVPCEMSWAFIVAGQPDGTTRLIVRERYKYLRWWAPVIIEPVAAASFVMSRKMLLSIRDRATQSTTSGSSDG